MAANAHAIKLTIRRQPIIIQHRGGVLGWQAMRQITSLFQPRRFLAGSNHAWGGWGGCGKVGYTLFVPIRDMFPQINLTIR